MRRGRPALGTASKLHSMEPKQSSTGGTGESPDHSGSWHFPLLLAVILILAIGIARLSSPPEERPTREPGGADWTPTSQPTGETVRLTIDFGNGARKVYDALPWQPEMTVADLMESAREFRPGIEFAQRGSGASGFLTSLDGLANEGTSGRNWIYRVDQQHAHQSFCLEKIEPGRHVLWLFTDQSYNEGPAEE